MIKTKGFAGWWNSGVGGGGIASAEEVAQQQSEDGDVQQNLAATLRVDPPLGAALVRDPQRGILERMEAAASRHQRRRRQRPKAEGPTVH